MSIPEEDFPQFCGRTDSMGVECERPELEKRISTLTEQLDAAKAETEKLENRHVQFMVEGGPVVMATDYDKLKAENDRLRAENERLCLPVAKEEWPKTWEGHPRPSITRSAVNSLIASRAAGAERNNGVADESPTI